MKSKGKKHDVPANAPENGQAWCSQCCATVAMKNGEPVGTCPEVPVKENKSHHGA